MNKAFDLLSILMPDIDDFNSHPIPFVSQLFTARQFFTLR